jgi:succinate dehydrogenase/fumarate reductase flavoprotein subunit
VSEDAFDIIVAGGGGAGLAAAIEGARAGARVVLVEKNPHLGGSTGWSVGSLSVACSPHQRRAGISDSPQDHYEDLEQLAGSLANRDNPTLRRLLVDNIGDTFTWLLDMGLVFTGPNPEPPHRVPRMHNVLPSSRAFPDRLGRRARSLGVDIRLDTPLERVRMADGRVTGAHVCDAHGQRRTLRAPAVVLAGGDYSASPALLSELVDGDAARLSPVNPTATGDGLRIGRDAGGHIVNGDLVRGPVLRFVPPPERSLLHAMPAHPLLAHAMRLGFEKLPRMLVRPLMMRFLTTALGLSGELFEAGALLVNARGERFTDEHDHPARATARQPGGEAHVLLDAAIARRFTVWPHFVSTAPGIAYAYLPDYRRTRPDVFHEAPTLEAVGERAGLDGRTLARTVNAWNTDRRARGSRPALATPPFCLLGPVKAYVPFTEGGLAVNESLQVLDREDNPIPGLYAAGSNGQGGVLLEGHGHHLGWAFVSGRIAGRHAARATQP